MKIAVKLLRIIGIILLVTVLLMTLLIVWLSKQPAVPKNYTRIIPTGGEIEAKYLSPGGNKVCYTEADAPGEWKKFEVYYPASLEEGGGPYPAVVFVNGTGIGGSKYQALFRHLASWGFIVLGSEDPSTCTGASTGAALAYLLSENASPESIFYQKADLDNIGLSGHSQGGVGVFNAATVNEHSGLVKTAVALSPTHEEGAAALGMFYDLTKLSIPTLMLAGTVGDFETQLVIPLEQMEKMYSRMDVPKVMARRTGCDHGQMLYAADGYVTAWLMWQLQGSLEAAGAFTGDAPEILRNPLYQDQRADLQ